MTYNKVRLGDFLYIKGRIGWKGLKKEEYLPSGTYRIINGESLTEKGIDWDRAGFITKERYDESPEIMLEIGDILVSKDGTIGKVGYVRSLVSPTTVASGIFVVRNIKPDIIDTDYIYYFLKSKLFKDFITTRTEGSVIPHLYQKDFVELEIPLPDIVVQKKISSVLNSFEYKTIHNNQLRDLLEEEIKTAYKLIINGEGVNKTNKRVKDLPLYITDYVSNGSFASLKENVTLFETPEYAYFIRNTDLKSGDFGVYVDESSYKFLSKSKLNGNEIIVSNVGDVGSVFLCPFLDKPMTLGNNVIMIEPTKEFYRYYFYCWLKWFDGKFKIQNIKGESAVPKFNKGDFKSMDIDLPLDVVLNKFDVLVRPMFDNLRMVYEENNVLQEISKAISVKIITGEIDASKVRVDY